MEEILNEIKQLKDKMSSLEKDVSDLKEYKSARERQQISEPLDEASQLIIDNRRIKT